MSAGSPVLEHLPDGATDHLQTERGRLAKLRDIHTSHYSLAPSRGAKALKPHTQTKAPIITNSTTIRGPQIPAVRLFRRVAPICVGELARQLHRAGLLNSHDLISAVTTGLSRFARLHGVLLTFDFTECWPEAFRTLGAVSAAVRGCAECSRPEDPG